MSNSGIYIIENLSNGKRYVGSAVNLNSRKSCHFTSLVKNKHANVKLQSAWNKYGECCFIFYVIEYVDDKTKLIEREQYWIDALNVVEDGYNISPSAGSLLGFKHSAEFRARCKVLGKTPANLENLAKLALMNIDRPCEKSTRIKISSANKNKVRTTAQRKNISTALLELPIEVKKKKVKKFLETMQNKTPEEKAEISNKLSNRSKGVPKPPRTAAHCKNISISASAAHARMSEEAKAAKAAKISATKLRKNAEKLGISNE